jgi:hypothetical protein
MICYRCATVLSLVGDDGQTLLALVQYLSGVADWKSSAQQHKATQNCTVC